MPRRGSAAASLARGSGLAAALLFVGPRAPAAPITSAEDPRPLADGVQAWLIGGQTRTYTLRLEAGQLLHVAVVPRGIDVALRLTGAGGTTLAEADLTDNSGGREAVSVLATDAGEVRLEVRSPDPRDRDYRAGGYRITVDGPRPPSPPDRDRVEAEALMAAGDRLAREEKAESFHQAIAAFDKALPLWRGLDDRFSEALCLQRQGLAWMRLTEYAKAQELLGEALRRWRALGERSLEGGTLDSVAEVQLYREQFQQALDGFQEALPIRQEVGDRRGEAKTLDEIGTTYSRLEQLGPSIGSHERALTLWRSLGDRKGEAIALNNLSLRYWQAGNEEKALETLFFGADTLRDTPTNRSTEAMLLINRGFVSEKLGEFGDALYHYGRSLELARSTGDRRVQALALGNLGSAHFALRETREALEAYEKALVLDRALNSRREVAALLVRMGEVHGSLGSPGRSADLITEGLRMARESGDARSEALALGHLGRILMRSGDVQKAFEHFDRALSLWKKVAYPPGEEAMLSELAQAEVKLGDLDHALEHIEAAVRINETRRRAVPVSLRPPLGAGAVGLRDIHVQILMRHHARRPGDGWDARAFGVSEKSRVQTLLEIMARSRSQARAELDGSFLDGKRSLEERLVLKQHQQSLFLSGPHTWQQAAAMEDEVRALRVEYEAFLSEPRVLSLADVQQRILDPGTLLMEYALGPESSALFTVDRTSLHAYVLPGREEIEAAVRRVHDLLARPGEGPNATPRGGAGTGAPRAQELREALRGIGATLLKPAAAELGRKRLVIVADGVLQYLPFATLPVPDRPEVPLLREHEVLNVPSASLLAVLREAASRRKPPSKTLVVFADPVFDANDERVQSRLRQAASDARRPVITDATAGRDVRRAAADTGLEITDSIPRVPFTRREAKAIQALAPAPETLLALDFEARRENVIGGGLSDYRFVHFATHGFLDNAHPALSGLLLSMVDREGRPQNGFLGAGDILAAKLSADLVVLSGCRTALGKDVKGEGIVGLTRALMHAGTPRVLASVWKVDDAATAALMIQLYEGLLKGGLRPAEALRRAQLAIAAQKRWKDPYYWAAFQLQGDWN